MRRLPRLPPSGFDLLVATGFTVASLLLARSNPQSWHEMGAPGYALTAVVNLSLAARRKVPLTVFVVCIVLWIVYIAMGYWPVVNSNAALLALYTVTSLRARNLTMACAVVMGGVWIYSGINAHEANLATVIAQAVIGSAVVWKFGDNARQLAIVNNQLANTAQELSREQEDRARRAVTDERVRIARELHDVVAHHMSVISVQAGLARYVFDTDSETARAALATIGATSSEALEEMRRLLTLLRIPLVAEPYDPAPGLGRIGELVERLRTAGVPVRVEITGRERPLPPGVDLAAFRVVQESLTNVLKHARPATAQVSLHYGDHELTARVVDDGKASPPTGDRLATGNGLIGMRERATLYGGTLDAGRRPQGGFEVVLTLPL
jgi:signal transduction histidine kinase